MNDFWKSDTARIRQNDEGHAATEPGLVQHWLEAAASVMQWARSVRRDRMRKRSRRGCRLWQPRPFYTAAELAPIFPMLAVALGLRARPEPQKSPARLANELRMARLPHFATRR
jgi:hypothetical protein